MTPALSWICGRVLKIGIFVILVFSSLFFSTSLFAPSTYNNDRSSIDSVMSNMEFNSPASIQQAQVPTNMELSAKVPQQVPASVPREVKASVHPEVKASVHPEVKASVPREVTASVPREVTASVPREATTPATRILSKAKIPSKAKTPSKAVVSFILVETSTPPASVEPAELPSKYTSPWTWTCSKDQKCRRTQKLPERAYRSLDSCWLSCGRMENLWPKPRQNNGQNFVGKDTINFSLGNLILKGVKARGTDEQKGLVLDLANKAFTIMKHNIKLLFPADYKDTNETYGTLSVSLRINSPKLRISLLTNESYTLNITQNRQDHVNLQVSISGETFFGIRHGLETLSQLIVFDEGSNSLQISKEVKLIDGPAFPYRGLMIDTARNFIPIPALKRMVDGMGQNKLNILHWHLTDSNSFPLFCPSFPQMTNYGAYSKDEIYQPEEVKLFVKYALLRGVKVIPEIDAPAHAGNGWQWGNRENGFGQLALCVNKEPFNQRCGQPPCGQLNPANPKVYKVLQSLYRDMLSIFDPDMFHMGGDEVTYDCWGTKEIKNFMNETNITSFVQLRTYFQSQAFTMLKMAAQQNLNKPPIPIIWTSDLTNALPNLINSGIEPTDYIIQTWDSSTSESLLEANFSMIVSNQDHFYLDLGSGTWLGKGHDWRYINWQTLYKFDFESHGYDTSKYVFHSRLGKIPQILGCEAALWTEKVNQDTMDSKLWPRGTALAERLWLNPSPIETKSWRVYARLLRQNERMRKRGIRVNSQQPKSCILINGNCENKYDPEP